MVFSSGFFFPFLKIHSFDFVFIDIEQNIATYQTLKRLDPKCVVESAYLNVMMSNRPYPRRFDEIAEYE